MNAPLTAKDFATDQEVRWRLSYGASSVLRKVLLSITFLILTAACTTAPNELGSSAIDMPGPLRSASTDINESSESICLGGQTFQGCCSKKSGVKDIRGTSLLCNDGSKSPSCAADISALLRGCCSSRSGIEGTRTDGAVICQDGSISPSCNIGVCEASSSTD
ncbi:MAG: hypothetical protein GXP04_07500 [Alphaproteobacteria bacterium]|nr:hypothetical protein [Alphaproteobacteria bacterium]